jgi:hypothetical protein
VVCFVVCGDAPYAVARVVLAAVKEAEEEEEEEGKKRGKKRSKNLTNVPSSSRFEREAS